MALTPEQLQAARQKYGVPQEGYGTNFSNAQAPAAPGEAPATGLAARLQSAWQPQATAPTNTFGKEISNIGDAFNKRVDTAAEAQVSNQNPFSKTLQTVGEGAGFVGDLAVGAARAAGSLVRSGDETLTSKFDRRVKEIGQSEPVQAALHSEPAQAVGHFIQDQAEQHPEAAKNIGALVNIAGAIPVGGAAKVAGEKAIEGTVDAAKGVAHTAEALTPNRGRAIDALEETYRELAGTTSKTAKVLAKGQAKTEALNKAGTMGDAPERILAESGIIPKQSGTKLDTLEQADTFRASTEPLRAANRDAIREVEHAVQKTSLDDLERGAIAIARDARNIDSGKAPDMVRDIQNAFAEYRKEYGDSIPLSKVDDIKSARWGDTKFDATKPLKSDVNYAIAKAAQKNIEDVAKSAGFDDVAQLNRHIGDRLEAAKFLESMHNKTVKGGRLGKYVLMGIGSTMGNSIPAKILGALGGDAVANLLISNSVAGPVKRLILRNLQTKDPEAYKAALKWMEEQNMAQQTRALLPEGSKFPIINDGKPVVPNYTEMEAPAAKIENEELRRASGRYLPERASPIQLP